MSEQKGDIKRGESNEAAIEESKTPDPIADAGSTEQATQGAGENLSETSEAVVGAVNALKGLADGSVSPIEAALDIKAAIDAVQGLSGQLSESLMMPPDDSLSCV